MQEFLQTSEKNISELWTCWFLVFGISIGMILGVSSLCESWRLCLWKKTWQVYSNSVDSTKLVLSVLCPPFFYLYHHLRVTGMGSVRERPVILMSIDSVVNFTVSILLKSTVLDIFPLSQHWSRKQSQPVGKELALSSATLCQELFPLVKLSVVM